MRRRIIALVLLGLPLVSCRREASEPDPQLVGQWLRTSLAFVRSERIGPPIAARISAYASLALYEGYASDSRSPLRSLGGQLNGFLPLPAAPEHVDGAVVAAEAERIVLDSLFRDGFASTRRTIDSLATAQIAARVAAGVSETLRDASVKHGRAIGAALLDYASTDGFFATRDKKWIASTGPGVWVNTITTDQFVPQLLSGQSDVVLTGNPNAALDPERASERAMFANRLKAPKAGNTLSTFNPIKPTEPYWGTIRTFAIRDGDECAPPAPPPYSEKPGSPFYLMAKEMFDSVLVLTPKKRDIALFWADNPVATGTPAFHWISVVNQMIPRRQLTADAAAEVYALTSIAIADAFVGCWKEKYRSMVVRPVTYVQRVFDKSWVTLFATPPFPEYPSGHSTLSAAAVQVLVRTLGDTIPFVDSTQVDIGFAPRPFASFIEARNEVAISRVYGGIHYPASVDLGMRQGECIGNRVLERLSTRKAAP